jgi:hypothetical protein
VGFDGDARRRERRLCASHDTSGRSGCYENQCIAGTLLSDASVSSLLGVRVNTILPTDPTTYDDCEAAQTGRNENCGFDRDSLPEHEPFQFRANTSLVILNVMLHVTNQLVINLVSGGHCL